MKAEIDTEQALQMVEDGKSYAEIAREFNVSTTTLRARLDEVSDSAHARARSISAEGWLDRALNGLEMAQSSEEITKARYIAQECARRAALRNPAYREKTAHEHTGADGKPIEYVRIERNIVKSE